MIDLSVILPIYNASPWIEAKLVSLGNYLDTISLTSEIIAVDDGSSDDTSKKLHNLPKVRAIISDKNLGKFGAISLGMKEAKGRCKLFTDCDLPYELQAIGYIASLILNRNFHIVTGDRTLPGSKSLNDVSNIRSLASRSFSLLVRLLVTGGLFDTQCGLKGFRNDVADAIFPLVQEKGFAGDLEVLYIALKYNLEIKRIPVRLIHNETSSIKLLKHSAEMALSLPLIPIRWYLGKYYSEELKKIAEQSY